MALSLEASVEAFYTAFNRMFHGDLSGVEAIWSQQDDISDMGTTGAIHRGRSAVIALLTSESTMGFDGKLMAVDRRIIEAGDPVTA